MKAQSEIPILDNLRAVAAWSVVLFHFICATIGLTDPNGFLFRIFNFGQFGVHLFFIISGMVIPWSLYNKSYQLKNIFRFLAKRLLRLEPPYLCSVILAVAFIYFRKFSPTFDGNEREITLPQVFLHLGYLVPFFENVAWLNNVYWTLAIEFQYYLVIGLLYFLLSSKQLLIRSLGYLVLVGAPLIFQSERLLPFWLPLFGVGIVLYLYKSQQIKEAELTIVSLLFVTHLFVFNSVVCGFIAVATEMVILFLFSKSNAVLSFLGKFSYSVYLMHTIVGAAFVNVFSHYTSGGFSKFMLVLGGIAVTFVSSYLMYLFVEKPSKKWSSKISF